MPFAAVRHRLPETALLLVTLLAASGWLFSKAVLHVLPPLLFMAIRFGLSALVLTGLVLRRQRWQGGVWRPALRGGLLLGLAMMCWVYGLSLSQHVGVAAFISSLGIVLAPFAARVLLGSTLSRRAWLGMVVAMAGMACL
ncbi:MAG: EamA family transporter, partial [Vogesella sp.]|uniref:EamA family transporter n=1 Tax=Vogesella sp. TaxID=1904252 RepID=UPI003F2F4270